MKKLISVLMVISMLCSCFSLMAFADGPRKGPQPGYIDTTTEEDSSYEAQLERLQQMLLEGKITQNQYQLAVQKVELAKRIESGQYAVPYTLGTKILPNFPYQKQLTEVCCGPACAKMVSDFAGEYNWSWDTIHSMTVCNHGSGYEGTTIAQLAAVLDVVQHNNTYVQVNPTTTTMLSLTRLQL